MNKPKRQGNDEGWIDAVARRAKVPPAKAEQILDSLQIRASPHLPRPRTLRLLQIRFAGEKLLGGAAQPFAFDWSLDAGVYCVASHGNLVGKSSVLRVILWALRGEPKLQQDVRSWIRDVELSFAVDDVRHRVAFTAKDGEVRGTVSRWNTSGPREIARFNDNREFASCMDEIMREALGLERLPSWQSFAGSEDGRVVVHGWPAYCGALVVAEAAHKVLLGDTEQAGLPGRLLQMFMGLPWATTLVSAKAKEHELSQRKSNAARRRGEDAAARDGEEARLRAEIQKAREELSAMGDGSVAIALAADAFSRLAVSQNKLLAAERSFEAARVDAVSARRQRLEDQSRLQDALESRLARRFFDGLEPSCCPRCDAAIDAERRKREKTADACAVCASALGVPTEDESALDQLRAAARASADADDAAKTRVDETKGIRDRLAAATASLNEDLATAQKKAAASAERRRAELDLARLEGALGERVRTRSAVDGLVVEETESDEVAVVHAAVQEADGRARTVADEIFSELNAEVCRLAQGFGMSALTSVKLDRAGRLAVTKGGQSSVYFSSLTPGERLRLRLATIAGLLRVASAHGVGRHPGLLLLDSPGSEEVEREDAAELVRELARVANEVGQFQVLVTTARPDVVATVLPPERIRSVLPGQFAW